MTIRRKVITLWNRPCEAHHIADSNSGVFLWDARTRNPSCRGRGARDGASATASLRASADGADAGGECAVSAPGDLI
jgi:hypothetical protein